MIQKSASRDRSSLLHAARGRSDRRHHSRARTTDKVQPERKIVHVQYVHSNLHTPCFLSDMPSPLSSTLATDKGCISTVQGRLVSDDFRRRVSSSVCTVQGGCDPTVLLFVRLVVHFRKIVQYIVHLLHWSTCTPYIPPLRQDRADMILGRIHPCRVPGYPGKKAMLAASRIGA